MHIFFGVRILFQASVMQFFFVNDMQFTSELICICLVISVVDLTMAQEGGIQFAKVITHLFYWPGCFKAISVLYECFNFNPIRNKNKSSSVNQKVNSLNLYPL